MRFEVYFVKDNNFGRIQKNLKIQKKKNLKNLQETSINEEK